MTALIVSNSKLWALLYDGWIHSHRTRIRNKAVGGFGRLSLQTTRLSARGNPPPTPSPLLPSCNCKAAEYLATAHRGYDGDRSPPMPVRDCHTEHAASCGGSCSWRAHQRPTPPPQQGAPLVSPSRSGTRWRPSAPFIAVFLVRESSVVHLVGRACWALTELIAVMQSCVCLLLSDANDWCSLCGNYWMCEQRTRPWCRIL